MERSLIKEVNIKGMSARLNSNKVKPMVFPNYFGIKKKDSLKWETLTGEKGVPVMGDVIAFDSTAPIKTREIVGKMSGDIPKIALKRGMNETDFNSYTNLAKDVKGDADLKALLDHVFEDFDFCYNGTRARMEWLTMQAASKAEFVLSTSNNAGVVTEQKVDFGVPAGNKIGVDIKWSLTATSKPLEDIEEWVETIEETSGRIMNYISMRKSDFTDLKNSADTISKVTGYNNSTSTLAVTQDSINAYLTANGLPVIVVVRPSVRFENKKNERSVVNPWEQYRVLFSEELKIGDVQHGPIAAEGNAGVNKIATLAKKDFVLMTKWSEQEPFGEWTKGEANAFPVLNDPDGLYYMDVEHTAWGEDA